MCIPTILSHACTLDFAKAKPKRKQRIPRKRKIVIVQHGCAHVSGIVGTETNVHNLTCLVLHDCGRAIFLMLTS